MIELTDEQWRSVKVAHQPPPQLVHPETKETFVLLPLSEYQELLADSYDDSPWTEEELMAQAWLIGEKSGWDEMNEYDDLPEK